MDRAIDDDVVRIRRYPNRRLYDLNLRRYVSLDDLAQTLRSGRQLRVEDARTGEDVTRSMLLQLLHTMLEGHVSVDTAMLHRWLQRLLTDTPTNVEELLSSDVHEAPTASAPTHALTTSDGPAAAMMAPVTQSEFAHLERRVAALEKALRGA